MDLLVHLLIGTATLLLLPDFAYAQLSTVVNQVAGAALPSTLGAGGVGTVSMVNIVIYLTERLRLVIDSAAVLFLVISGLKLIYRASEEQVESSKRVIGGSIAAIMLAHLGPRFVEAIYGTTGAIGGTRWETTGALSGGVSILSVETLGVIRWAETLLAALAVTIIIVSGLRAIADPGSEQGITQLKRTVFATIAGILLIVMREAIKLTFGLQEVTLPGSPDALIIITRIMQIVAGLLSFMALVAVAVTVYAGVMMIIAGGSEEQFRKHRTLVIRAAIGLLVILVSLTLTFFILNTVCPTC